MTSVKSNYRPASVSSHWMNELFQEFPTWLDRSIFPSSEGGQRVDNPPVNILSNQEGYQIELLVPGWKKEDFQIALHQKTLEISAVHVENKEEESKENGWKVIKRGFNKASFKKSFQLETKIDAENITAQYNDGILVLQLPRIKEAVPEVKKIEIQ